VDGSLHKAMHWNWSAGFHYSCNVIDQMAITVYTITQ